MAKALKIAAVVVGVAALAVVTGGAALGLGVSLATTLTVGGAYISAGALLLGSAALGLGASLLQGGPKVTASQTERLNANIDPRAFRKTVLGQTAMPVDVRYEEFSGSNQEYCDWIVAVASHAIDGVEEIWLNTDLAWSQTTGARGQYAGYFSVPNIVLEGSPANAFTFGSGKWNAASAHLTGCAYLRLRFKRTGNGKKATSPFASAIPSRITIIGRGAKLYDPRRDSTVPGGSGPMRADDQSTWRFTADDGAVIGENLPLQILREVLGWRIRNPVTGEMRLATGSGVPARRLDLGSFIVAANQADELVNRSAGGTEPRYHGAAVLSEGDDPKSKLDMLCAGCCGRFRDTAGKLSLVLMHNDLAAAAMDDGLVDDDVVGAFTWDPDAALESTPNVVRGKYVDASSGSLYQLIDYPEVRLPSIDGQDRIFPLDLGVVESPSQAQRVAKQVLQRKQYPREFTAPFDIRAWNYVVGDPVPFTFAPLAFVRRVFRVKAQDLGQGGVCNMTLSVEHPSIYAWDKDDAAPVVAAEPNVYDSRNNPLILAIADLDSQVSAILSDNVITHGREKRELVLQWQGLEAEFLALDARYAALGNPAEINPARDAANTAYHDLAALLAGLAPAWDDVATDTPVDGGLLNQRWSTARSKIETFAAAITGRPGEDGRTSYLHYAYANSDDGRVDFDPNQPNGRAYEGSYTDFTPADSSDPAAYVWREYRGPPFGLASRGTVVVAGSSLIKNGGAADWDSDAFSTIGIRNGCRVSFVGRGNDALMAGLNTDPTADASYGSLDYAWYLREDGYADIWESNTSVTGGAAVVGPGYGQGRFELDYDNRYVRYLYNAVEYRKVEVGAGKLFYFDSSFLTPGGRLNEISFSARGAAGTSPVTAILTNDNFTVPTASDGSYSAFPVDTSRGQMRVYDGSVEVTAQCTFTIQNPYALDGRIDADGSYYAIGLYADSGYSYLIASYKGVAYVANLSASKVPGGAKGADGINPPLVSGTANPQAIRYDRNDVIASGDVVFTATLVNAIGPVSWSSSVGHSVYNTPGVSFSGNTMTYTAARMAAVLAYNEANFGHINETIVVSASGVSDRVTVTKIKDGATGAAGADGLTVTASTSALLVPALYTGVVKDGVLPRAVTVRATRGGTDVSAGVVLSVTASSGLGVSTAGNVVTLDSATSDGTITVSVAYAGAAISELKISVTRVPDPAPPQSQSSATTGYNTYLNQTTYGSVTTPTLVLQTAANGSFDVHISAGYSATGPANTRRVRVAAKAQYRTPGGVWADFGSEVVGDYATYQQGEPDASDLLLDQTVSGLAANQSYEVQGIFRIFDRLPSTTYTTVNGLLSVQVTP